ncbi:diguanylate cyclase [Streptomyces roseirectus]|uniref:Diguanylate cyclase n=1 Tax=Streptomyces roseirectus TaxID=2768066 RepID=A0A7H0INK4_9ACTN|nr:diguanylate cyclase [Streptomyces roseirectus]QNP74370.1 diguanylate cyclase [Streptomyces roseirectus]
MTRSWRHWRRGEPERIPTRSTDAQDASRRFLLYGILPLWVVPGLADWWLHRRTGIEHTSGVRESAVHAAMMTEAGVPVVLGLVARVNPLVLSVMGGAALAHGATAVYDVTYATGRREVSPVEQHVHSFLEVLPLTALAFTACLHADQVRDAVRGRGEWRLRPRERPLPARYLAALAAVIGTGVALPYAEELRRCLRAR